MNFIIDNKIFCIEFIPDVMEKVVIYCHGFGESKDRIYQHCEVLNKKNIGIIGFDFPCHGFDKGGFSDFTIANSILYLNKVIDYARKFNVPIVLMGSSFGGFIVLNRINDFDEKFDKVFLKYPAVNFYECTKRKLKIDLEFFDSHDFYQFLNGRRLLKDTFNEIMNIDLMNCFDSHNNDIYIIHGDKDKTVLLDDIVSFCNKNSIKLDVIKNAEHGMKDYLDVVNEKLITYITK